MDRQQALREIERQHSKRKSRRAKRVMMRAVEHAESRITGPSRLRASEREWKTALLVAGGGLVVLVGAWIIHKMRFHH